MSMYVGKEMQTRSGRKARIIAIDRVSPLGLCVVALVKLPNAEEEAIQRHRMDGSYGVVNDKEDPNDLIEIPVINSVYRVVYDNGVFGTTNFLSKQDAIAAAGPNPMFLIRRDYLQNAGKESTFVGCSVERINLTK